jgi:polar amino acid transport system substrate-binding protein
MTKGSRLVAATLVALACATTATATAAELPKTDTRIAGEVPAKIRAKGTLVVATAAAFAPNEFTPPNGQTILGMDPDLTRALAAVLGLHVRFVNVRFDAIIPGVASGTYALGVSSITDTTARQKLVDFVDYFSAGTAFFVKANAGPSIKSPADLCGRTVAVVAGTTQNADAQAQDTACVRAGKRDVTIAVFPDQIGAEIAIESSETAVGMADSPIAAYIVKQSHGLLELTGKPYGTAPYGIALPKDSGMAKPVLDALKKLIADGTYRTILTKWGIEIGAITNPQVNGAAS